MSEATYAGFKDFPPEFFDKKKKKRKKKVEYKTKEERKEQVVNIIKELSKFELNLKYEPVKELYKLPAGRVKRTLRTQKWRTEVIDKMLEIADRSGLKGPFVQVGDKGGRVFWRSEDTREYGVRIPQVGELMRNPNKLLLIPEKQTRILLNN